MTIDLLYLYEKTGFTEARLFETYHNTFYKHLSNLFSSLSSVTSPTYVIVSLALWHYVGYYNFGNDCIQVLCANESKQLKLIQSLPKINKCYVIDHHTEELFVGSGVILEPIQQVSLIYAVAPQQDNRIMIQMQIENEIPQIKMIQDQSFRRTAIGVGLNPLPSSYENFGLEYTLFVAQFQKILPHHC